MNPGEHHRRPKSRGCAVARFRAASCRSSVVKAAPRDPRADLPSRSCGDAAQRPCETEVPIDKRADPIASACQIAAQRPRSLPRARGGGASGSGSLLDAYIDAAGIRAETKIPSSALPPAGPVRSSERQEPHRTPSAWSQALRPHRRRTQARRGRTDQDLARFPHWREEHAPCPADHHRQTARPLGDPRRRWVRDSVRPRLLGFTHPATLSHPDWRGRSRLPYG